MSPKQYERLHAIYRVTALLIPYINTRILEFKEICILFTMILAKENRSALQFFCKPETILCQS